MNLYKERKKGLTLVTKQSSMIDELISTGYKIECNSIDYTHAKKKKKNPKNTCTKKVILNSILFD